MTLNEYATIFRESGTPELYSQWVRVKQEMSVHSQGIVPVELLLQRHPNEDSETIKWRHRNYNCITRGIYERGLSALNRIFKDSGFSVELAEMLSKNNILEERWYYGYNFWLFFQQVFLPSMIEDPNGLLVWIPQEQVCNETCNIGDDELRVLPKIIPSNRVIYRSIDLTIIESDERSYLREGQSRVMNGAIYYGFTANDIFKSVQIGKKYDNQFSHSLYYNHDIGTPPVTILGGKQKTLDGSGMYFESFFNNFLPFANECLRQFSDWQAVQSAFAYPIKEVASLKCHTCGGFGTVHNNDLDCVGDCMETCRTCNGSGMYVRRGIFDAVVRPEHVAGIDVKQDDMPLIRFHTPPVEILEHMQKSWQLYHDKAEESLCLRWIMEAQSGLAKSFDREEQTALLTQISNCVYDEGIANSLYFLERYYGGTEYSKVIKPVSFNVKTEEELEKDYDTFVKSDRCRELAIQTAVELAGKKFGGDGFQSKVIKALSVYDPLYMKSDDQIVNLITSNIFTENDGIRSRRAYSCLMKVIEQQGKSWFMGASFDEINKYLEMCMEPFLKPEQDGKNGFGIGL